MNKSYLKNFAKNLCWWAYGGTIRNPPLPSDVNSILFICLGNICRSPFAERIATKYSHTINKLIFYSAGILVESPKMPTEEAIVTAMNYGIDLKGHRSRLINYRMMESYDAITTMETWQYKYLRKIFQEFTEKIFLLPLFCNNKDTLDIYDNYNIKDPYGKNFTDYDECFRRIEGCVSGLLSNIERNKERGQEL